MPHSPLTNAQLSAITDALRKGQKIEAIKLHRAATGLGLKDAKEEIEIIESDLRAKFPDQFPIHPQGKGCLGLVALFLITGASATAWWLNQA